MTFLDTDILVGAILTSHPQHEACSAAVEDFDGPFTNAHALARNVIDRVEKEFFTKAARWLGVTRTTMREKLNRFGVSSHCEADEN